MFFFCQLLPASFSYVNCLTRKQVNFGRQLQTESAKMGKTRTLTLRQKVDKL